MYPSKMTCCTLKLLFFATLIFNKILGENIIDEDSTNDEKISLPECPYIDPMVELERWAKYDFNKCNITIFEAPKSVNGNSVEEIKQKWGYMNFGFNIYVSDKIGPKRDIKKQAHELCNKLEYKITLKASIVLVYHNEALSVLIRMLNGIFNKTSNKLFKEIILYDDYSDKELVIENYLKEYGKIEGWNMDKIKFYKSEEREGLIRAKVLASRKATGDVLVFLDSHCEPNDRWLEPLLDEIQKNNNIIALPIVDLINPNKFDYSKAMFAKSGFDWSLYFRWEYISWDYFKKEENNIIPVDSPGMPGGLLAIHKDFFIKMGEYDMGMLIWGAENIEMSIKAWMCGGGVKVVPCSRVGHLFRHRRPYKSLPGLADSNLLNSLRTVKVWFDEYEEQFYLLRPKARQMDAGNITDRIELRKKLNCKPFKWYLENIYPKLLTEIRGKKDEL
uniref:Glyco_trans_2-like domain-containing protein n=1 Tax=Parastrongyloides trichosuri TaxID=131310 RepID=A0A0N5A2G5_PARTI